MRVIRESITDPTSEDRFSVLIQKAIQDEQEAIDFYEKMLEHPDVTKEQTEIIKELLKDETDHLAILSSSDMMYDQVQEEFPNSGEE